MSGIRLLTDIERIERLHEEKQTIESDIRDIYKALASDGFDKTAVRELVKRRAKDPSERREFETIVDLYEQQVSNASRGTREEAA